MGFGAYVGARPLVRVPTALGRLAMGLIELADQVTQDAIGVEFLDRS